MLVDSHCHLNFPALYDNLDAVVQRASDHNVQYMQTICTQKSDYDTIISIVEKYENIFGSVGIHPHHTNKEFLTSHELCVLAQHKKIIGIGETGLDYYYEYSDRVMQKRSFEEHILASHITKLPIIIHTRLADDNTSEIIVSNMQSASFTGLLHCFTSGRALAKVGLDCGLYISISGICTFDKSHDLTDIIKFIPLDRLLIETDAPYLAPIPHRGKSNEPGFVRHVAAKIAEIKEISFDVVAEQTTANFFALFAKCHE